MIILSSAFKDKEYMHYVDFVGNVLFDMMSLILLVAMID